MVDIDIGRVDTEIVVTKGVGPLSPEDVAEIARLVLQKVRQDQQLAAARGRDTDIGDRAYRRSV